MPKTISCSIQLKKETIYLFQVKTTSASLNDVRIPSPRFFPREQAERLFTELFLMLAHPQVKTNSKPEQHIQDPGAQEICITQRMHPDSTSLPTILGTKPNNLLALLTVTLTCSLQDKPDGTIMPKSNEYVGRRGHIYVLFVKLRTYRS